MSANTRQSEEATVLLCRFCGHLNDPLEPGARCAQCGAFSGLEAVAAGEARQRSRRVRLDFLRNRLVRVAVIVLPLLGLLMYVLWTYTGLPPDPPQPTTAMGDTAIAPAPGDWPQAGGGAANVSAAVGSSVSIDGLPSASGGWEYTAGAPIVAPPAVAGDRVYLTAEDGSVVALERDTGAVVWQYDSGLTAAVTPAVSDGLVFRGIQTRRRLCPGRKLRRGGLVKTLAGCLPAVAHRRRWPPLCRRNRPQPPAGPGRRHRGNSLGLSPG